VRWPEWLPGERGPGGGALRFAQAALVLLAVGLPISIAVTETALVCGLLALAVSRLRGRKFRAADGLLMWASVALIGAWTLSSLLGENPPGALQHVGKLYALGLILLAAEAGADERVRRRALAMLVASAVYMSMLGFLIFAVRLPSRPNYRLASVFSNQMTSGGVLAAALLWSLGAALARRDRTRFWFAAALAPLSAALVLTQTRSHWLGAVAGAGVIVMSLAPRFWWALPATLAVALPLLPHRLHARLYSIVDPHEPGNQGRLSMWRSARDIIRDHPVFGVGCQDLLALYRRYRYPDWTFESGHFHNNFIQMTVMTGVVGLAAFLLWLVSAARAMVRSLRAAAAGADRGMAAAALGLLTALLVSGMFDYTFGDAEVVYHTFLALGFALAIAPGRPAGPAPQA
jgi:O-antigen ligase